MIRVDDPDDPRVAPYRHIKERDLVGREGRFIAEGTVVLRAMLQAGRFALESLLLLENRLQSVADLLPLVPEGTPVFVADRRVMDAVAGFPIHRGVLGVGRKRPEEDAATLLGSLGSDALVVALCGIANHDNVGAIFRNAAAFGADCVLLEAGCCDPLYRKAIRVSVGAALTVPFARAGTTEALIALLRGHGFDVLALSPSGGRDITAVEPRGRQALLLGSEGDGLPAALLAGLDPIRIAMTPRLDSLNVAAASAIALHRLWRG